MSTIVIVDRDPVPVIYTCPNNGSTVLSPLIFPGAYCGYVKRLHVGTHYSAAAVTCQETVTAHALEQSRSFCFKQEENDIGIEKEPP